MFNKILIDINKELYNEISCSPMTPQELKLSIINQADFQPHFNLYQFKRNNGLSSEWVIYLSILYNDQIYIFSNFCKQIPTFLMAEIFNIIKQTSMQHQGNGHLINQVLNQNGLKNYEQIIKDIFLQEIQNSLEEDFELDASNLYKDYMYLFQQTLNTVRRVQNSLSLIEPENREHFYDLLSIEKSLTDLNSDFLILYFFRQKELAVIEGIELYTGLKSFIPYFESKVVYHLKLLSSYLVGYMNESKQMNAEFQSILIYLENLKDCFKEINSIKAVIVENEELKSL